MGVSIPLFGGLEPLAKAEKGRAPNWRGLPAGKSSEWLHIGARPQTAAWLWLPVKPPVPRIVPSIMPPATITRATSKQKLLQPMPVCT